MHIGEAAPDFELRDLKGTAYRLRDFSDSIVIVDFWSCACPHVDRTDELLARWWDEGWDRGVKLLRVAPNASESAADIAGVAAQRNIPLILIDSDQTVTRLYDAETTPHVFVIMGGLVRYCGAVDDASFARRMPTRYYLQEAVEALLAGNTPPVSSTPPFGCAIIHHALE